MSSLREIRTALRATISQADLNVYRAVPDVTNTPAAVVLPSNADYTGAMGMGGDEYYIDIAILVAALNIADAQDVLDDYVTGQGPKSVREFIYRNSNLGLDDVDCTVVGFKGYNGSFENAMTQSIGAILKVRVLVL